MRNFHLVQPRRPATRAPFAVMIVMFVLALLCSGCCGSCCRAILGSGGGSGGSGNSRGMSSSPNSGSVSSLVARQVGPFRLKGTAPVTRLGSGLRPGVIDSIGAVYTGPGGVTLNQIILAYSSEHEASSRMDAVFNTISRECSGKRLMRADIHNESGVLIGKKVVCDRDPQHVYWSNGRVLMFVTASHPGALQFYNASGH